MKARALGRWVALFLLVLGALRPGAPVQACNRPPGDPPPLSERYAAAEQVMIAEVVWLGGAHLAPGVFGSHYQRFFETFQRPLLERSAYAIVRVQAYYKGGGDAEVAILGFGFPGDCLSSLDVGETGIFFATGEPPLLTAQYLYPFSAVMPADAAHLDQLAALNPTPRQPDVTTHDWGGRLVLLAGSFAVIGAALTWRLVFAGSAAAAPARS